MSIILLFAFMLIPIWIPLIAAAVGYVSDAFRRSAQAPALTDGRSEEPA